MRGLFKVRACSTVRGLGRKKSQRDFLPQPGLLCLPAHGLRVGVEVVVSDQTCTGGGQGQLGGAPTAPKFERSMTKSATVTAPSLSKSALRSTAPPKPFFRTVKSVVFTTLLSLAS